MHQFNRLIYKLIGFARKYSFYPLICKALKSSSLTLKKEMFTTANMIICESLRKSWVQWGNPRKVMDNKGETNAPYVIS